MSGLQIEGLRLQFGALVALDGVDIALPPGRLTGLIGPNGAGKTTLFNTIAGSYRAGAGRVRFAGQDITRWRADRIARAGLVRTFQITRNLASLTVLENLMLHAPAQPGESFWPCLLRPAQVRAREQVVRRTARDMAQRLELDRVLDAPAHAISGGQRKLLELGRALMASPRMVLLDEPAAGVNPTLVRRLVAHIREAHREGVGFLVIEHNMGMVAELCEEVVVMAQGRHLVQGRFAEVQADARVQQAYMGKRA